MHRVLMLLAALAPLQTSAQSDYPNRPIRIIVPTAPGGGNDIVGRLIAQGLFERLGRQVGRREPRGRRDAHRRRNGRAGRARMATRC
jgi:hypothetical protein